MALANLTLVAGCAGSSSGGGGAQPAKPDLKPATTVTQSFTVVKNAGQGSSAPAALSLHPYLMAASSPNGTNENSSNSVESTGLDQKVRVQKLKASLANNTSCAVKFDAKQPNSGSQTISTGFSLKISGARCPMSADFLQSFDANSNSSKIAMNYKFKVTDSNAQNLVGASEASLNGTMNVRANSDGTISGLGKFSGVISSVQYGRVQLVVDLKLDVAGNQDQTYSGVESEVTTLKFTDSSKNITFNKTATYDHSKGDKDPSAVNYTANGATITEAEYNQVLEGLNSADSSSSNSNSTSN